MAAHWHRDFNLTTLVSGWRLTVLAGLIGAVAFFLVIGSGVLNPANVSWLMEGDAASTGLGFLFFRDAAWALPLGRIPSYAYPLDATVALTDSLPWLALIFKLLSPVLPASFQYIGLWLLACYVLQAVSGFLLLRTLTRRPVLSLLAAPMFLLAPIWIQRLGHLTLFGEWLVLAALWLAIRPQGRATYLGMVALNLFAAGVHPYLLVMTLFLTLAGAARQIRWQRRSLVLVTAECAGLVLAAAAPLWLFGYLGGTTDAGGWGGYSADLLTLVNPMVPHDWPLWPRLPVFPVGAGRYEGAAYLGLGGLIAVTLGFVLFVRSWKTSKRWLLWLSPVILVCLGFAIFSLSTWITVAGELVLNVGWLLRAPPVAFLARALRASGRFIWPLAYLLPAAGLALIIRRLPWRVAATILAVLVVVQAIDVQVWRFPERKFVTDKPSSEMIGAVWQTLAANYDTIDLIPPEVEQPRCPSVAVRATSWIRPALFAGQHHLRINSGHLARTDLVEMGRYCNTLGHALNEGAIRAKTAYIVQDALMERFRWWVGDRAACAVIDGRNLCVARGTPLAAALARSPDTIPMTGQVKLNSDLTLPLHTDAFAVLVGPAGLGTVTDGARTVTELPIRLGLSGYLRGEVQVTLTAKSQRDQQIRATACGTSGTAELPASNGAQAVTITLRGVPPCDELDLTETHLQTDWMVQRLEIESPTPEVNRTSLPEPR